MHRTLARRFSLALALLGAGLAYQAPEFAQQYRQRLGGALQELDAIADTFAQEAHAQSLDVPRAIERLMDNLDPLAVARGEAMQQVIERRDALRQQSDAMSAAGPIGRILVMVDSFDPAIAKGAWSDFEPGLPVTREAFIVAGAGFFIFYVLGRLLTLPFRQRKFRPAQSA